MFRATVVARPVEIVCGIAMIVVGVGVTAASAGAEPANEVGVTAGGILTALGGVLLSWVFSVVVGRRQGLEDIGRQLDAVSRSLGQASGQITYAVEDATSGNLTEETALEIIATSAKAIYGQVNEIQIMLGNRFDSRDLLDTVTELDSMARQLSSRASSNEKDAELAEMRNRLTEVRSSLEKAGFGARSFSVESLNCPQCGVPNEVSLGDKGGATATVRCGSCGERFNAHRRSDGTTFTRTYVRHRREGQSGNRQVRVRCPGCGNQIALVAGSDDEAVTRACFDCMARVAIDVRNQTAKTEGLYDVTPIDRIRGWRDGRPILGCPVCQEDIRAIYRMGDHYYVALCNRDNRLLRVEVAASQEQRRELADSADAQTESTTAG